MKERNPRLCRNNCPLDKLVPSRAVLSAPCRFRDNECKYDRTRGGERSDKAQRVLDGGAGKVLRYTQPGEGCGTRAVEGGGIESHRERVALEVHRRPAEVGREGDAGRREGLA